MEIKWGIIPDMSITQTLRDLVRLDVAKELTFTGRIVEANEAAELGLITRVCQSPLEEAENWLKKSRGNHPIPCLPLKNSMNLPGMRPGKRDFYGKKLYR